MKKLLAWAIAPLCALLAAQALAANAPTYKNSAGQTVEAQGVVCVLTDGSFCDPSGSPSGGATASNQTAVQADPGSDASKATAVQGVTGGKAVKVDGSAVTQPVSATGAAASGSANFGNPVKVGCVFNNPLASVSSGQAVDMQCDAKGEPTVVVCNNGSCAQIAASPADNQSNSANSLKVYSQGALFDGSTLDLQRSIDGQVSGGGGTGVTAVEQAGALFSHIATNTTTTIKSGAGIVHKVCINTKGASANTATVYDNTTGSGTVLAVLDTTAQVGCLAYDARFATGLTIVTATGTAADLTVSYR